MATSTTPSGAKPVKESHKVVKKLDRHSPISKLHTTMDTAQCRSMASKCTLDSNHENIQTTIIKSKNSMAGSGSLLPMTSMELRARVIQLRWGAALLAV